MACIPDLEFFLKILFFFPAQWVVTIAKWYLTLTQSGLGVEWRVHLPSLPQFEAHLIAGTSTL